MTASLEVSVVGAPHLSTESLARLQALLLAQNAENDAILSQLAADVDLDSLLERELAEAAAARVRKALDDIENALERLAKGTYGHCEACAVPMPFERLEAIPAARYCVSCSRRRGGLLR